MKNLHLPKLRFYVKGFPEDARYERQTAPESLEIARGTLYETWYNCLKISPYTEEALHSGLWRSKKQKITYEKFGDLVDTNFDSWWLEHGFELFKEKEDFKKIEVLDGTRKKSSSINLILEIPMTISPSTLKVQFDKLLQEHHPQYRNFDRWQFSTATERLRSSRLTSASLNLYLRVFEQCSKNKRKHLYTIGEEMSLNPRFNVKRSDAPTDIPEKHEQMSLIVSDYLKKAKNLIAHASEGKFPCTDDHEWIERSTRVRRSRYGD